MTFQELDKLAKDFMARFPAFRQDLSLDEFLAEYADALTEEAFAEGEDILDRY